MPRKKKEEIEKIEETAEVNEEVVEEKSDNKDLKKRTSDRSVLLKELKKKAEEMKKKISGVDSEDIKEELEKKRELLISLNDYVKTGIHLGTKVITPDMKQYVYRRRADSIAVLNTGLIDDQIKKAIDFMAKYNPEEIALVCKREAGWDAAKLFEQSLGIKAYTKKYPAGMMTNVEIQDFSEPELVIVCDSWVDRNSLKDAVATNKKVIMIADTNNYVKKANIIIPANNKSNKSLGLIFYLLAKGYVEKRKMKVDLPSMNSFTGDEGQEI
jgi:small subunit ribosomal protein S2